MTLPLGARVIYDTDIHTVLDWHHINGRQKDDRGPRTTGVVVYIIKDGDSSGFWISESEVELLKKTVPIGTVARRPGGIDAWVLVDTTWRNVRTGNSVSLDVNDHYSNDFVYLFPDGTVKKGSEL